MNDSKGQTFENIQVEIKLAHARQTALRDGREWQPLPGPGEYFRVTHWGAKTILRFLGGGKWSGEGGFWDRGINAFEIGFMGELDGSGVAN